VFGHDDATTEALEVEQDLSPHLTLHKHKLKHGSKQERKLQQISNTY